MLRRYLRAVPYRSRPALYYESLYSIGRGAFVALLPFSWVVLKTVLDGELWQLTVLGCIWGLSGLLAPGWAWLARLAGLQRLVVWPNMAGGLALAAVVLVTDATAFVLVVSLAYLVAVPDPAHGNEPSIGSSILTPTGRWPWVGSRGSRSSRARWPPWPGPGSSMPETPSTGSSTFWWAFS